MKDRIKWFKKFFSKTIGEADSQYQAYVDEVHELAFARAFELLRISDQEVTLQNPIVLLEPEQLDSKNKVKYKIVAYDEETTELVYDQSLITILLFGEESLFYYQANLDYRYGLITNDVVGEISYIDIINVQTSFEYDDLHDPLLEMVHVDLWLIDGTTIPFRLRHRLFNGVMEELVLSEQEREVLTKFHEIARAKRKLV